MAAVNVNTERVFEDTEITSSDNPPPRKRVCTSTTSDVNSHAVSSTTNGERSHSDAINAVKASTRHAGAAQKREITSNAGIASEMRANSLAKLNAIDLNELILYIFTSCESQAESMLKKPDFLLLKADLAKIKAKCENQNAFKSGEEFLLEMRAVKTKWESQKAASAYTHQQRSTNNIFKAMAALFRHAKADIEAAKLCVDCVGSYYLHNHFFVKVCRNPHQLVWAKFGTSSLYWPAKVINYRSNTKKLAVQYFNNGNKVELDMSKSK